MASVIHPKTVRRYRINGERRRAIRNEWVGMFRDTPCFIFGNGPSLNEIDPFIEELENNYITIGINRSYKKILSNFLFFQDESIYTEDPKGIESLQEKLLIVYRYGLAYLKGIPYHQIAGEWRWPTSILNMHGAKTSLPLAMQIAYCFRFNPIIICGCDCGYKDGLQDFYGENKRHHKTTLSNAEKGFDWVIQECEKKKINIINCSDNGRYKYTPIKDIINNLPQTSRQEVMDKIKI